MKCLKLALIGFGNAGREFAKILTEKGEEFSKEFGCKFSVVAISTRSRGSLVNSEGIDLKKAILELETQERFLADNPSYSTLSSMEIIKNAPADVVVEITPLNIMTGQPAIDHIKTALTSGKHVITANKGPIAWAYEELKALAEREGKLFLFEGTVMDGTPIFNLVRETLLGCEITGIKGILNSTTNFIFCEMEKGQSFEAALKETQRRGFAEADPTMDLEGWDAAAKTTALLNVLMGAGITPKDIDRTGVSHITAEDLSKAKKEGKTIKLICEGYKKDGKIFGKVAPTLIPLSDPLAQIQGTTSAVTITTDLMGELTIIEKDPEITQTAYAIVADMLTLAKKL
jgi:homoserine dehydrogenase